MKTLLPFVFFAVIGCNDGSSDSLPIDMLTSDINQPNDAGPVSDAHSLPDTGVLDRGPDMSIYEAAGVFINDPSPRQCTTSVVAVDEDLTEGFASKPQRV